MVPRKTKPGALQQIKTVILGLDALDPTILEKLVEQGELPNLHQFVSSGCYNRFEVANPPQSEVSWTSIATGADPGSHGLFDFVHRDPQSYTLIPSLLQTKNSILGTSFIPPYSAQTIFEMATQRGYPATAIWWPALFPARPELPVATIPGLGTPDVMGRLGVGTVYSPDQDLKNLSVKTSVEILNKNSSDLYDGTLKGPMHKVRGRVQEASIEFQLEIRDEQGGRLRIGKQQIELRFGEWSPIIELTFRLGFMMSVTVITRIILNQAGKEPRIYFLPLQIHPLHTSYRYATPPRFVNHLWKTHGPFLTLGWPQDTTGLEEGWISDDQFLSLCQSIDRIRENIFFQTLSTFSEGLLANVFDTLDRVQHMFLHHRPDIVENYYRSLDALVGKTVAMLGLPSLKRTRLLIVSDHGFTQFHTKVHLNRWLFENGYLSISDENGPLDFSNVEWKHTRAYALGLNSLYLNIVDREGQGVIKPDEIETVRNELIAALTAFRDPSGRVVVNRVYKREEAYSGDYLSQAPDLVVGYAPGFRASAETGLGKWEDQILVPNRDHWGADHCIDPLAVPGVIICSDGLSDFPRPSFRDIPVLATGSAIEHPNKPTVSTTGERKDNADAIEERLKGLGYL